MTIYKLFHRSVLVFADLHLAGERNSEIESFVDGLNALDSSSTDEVVILGDLFDAWVGPGGWEEAGMPALREAFCSLKEREVGVWFVRGNRDVLFEQADASLAGGQVVDELLCGDPSAPQLLIHGDSFCLRDTSYQRLRKALRWPPLRKFLCALPRTWRRWLGRRLRGASQGAIGRKPLDSMAVVESAVVDAGEGWGACGVVMGHLHVGDFRELDRGVSLRVLPAWEPGSRGFRLATDSKP